MVRHFLMTMFMACLLAILCHYYLYMRLVIPMFGPNNDFWITTFIILGSVTVFGFAILRALPHALRKIFEVFMFLWMGIAFIGLMVCLITLPIDVAFKFLNINGIYLWYFVVITTGVLSLYAVINALRLPTVFREVIPVPNHLPAEIEEIKIAVISDVHVSGLIDKKRVQKIVEIVNSLKPDVIFVTGDLMDGILEKLSKQMTPFKKMHANKKIVYITGNHEFYSGPHFWKDFFKNEFNWKILSNSSHIIPFENFQINVLGIEDRHWLKYKRIPKTEDVRLKKSVAHLKEHTKETDLPAYNILLAHQPKDWKEFIQFPFIHLQISGHTHGGGQIWPLHYLVKKDQTYYAGLSKIPKTHQHIYVNRGTGFWGPPMRLGTTSEITLMTFVRR